MGDATNLKISENKYRSLFENVHDGIYQSTVDGKILTANPALVKMLGYDSEDELIKMNIGRDLYVNPSGRDSITAILREKGILDDVELKLKRKDGVHITVLEHSYTVNNERGDILYYEGTLTEITERKRVEEALRESEKLYQSLIETSHDGISLFDLNGRMKFFNQRKKNMLHYDIDEEVLQISAFDIIHPDDRQLFTEIFTELFNAGTINRKELRVMRKNGTYFWIEYNATLIKDDDGRPSFVVDTMRDISDRRLAEEQIHMLKYSVDVHYDGAYWMNTENKFVYVNDTACRISGYTRDEIIGQDISFINPNATKEAMSFVWERLRENGFFTAESTHCCKDGRKYPVEIVSTYIKYGGKEYNCGFARDITEKKKMLEDLISAKERAEESDRLKTSFLQNISHEIRTPMNAIVGFTSLLDSPNLTSKARRQYMDIIFDSSEHLLSIISDIVDISNIEAGGLKLSSGEVNINNIIRSLFAQYHVRTEEQNINLRYSTPLDDDFVYIITDGTKLVQVISNLLNNSLKFTSKGSIDYGYTIKNNIIEFYVRDTGFGIEKDNLKKIFDRFYKISDINLPNTTGTGLGLAISKAYVEIMGGKIWVESQPGIGSDFYFTIPFKSSGQISSPVRRTDEDKPDKVIQGKTILIAEDDNVNFNLLQEFLSDKMIKIIRATTGVEAVNACRLNEYIDLILMDLKMPLMDGFKAFELIKEFRPSLPVIAVTAYALDSDKAKVLASGFSGYVSKPINMNYLFKLINQYLK
jgi:PAS domain S-box-containing protein